jgi:hypothetical protein
VDNLVGPAGIEPATAGLEIRCSIRLSYGPKLFILQSFILQRIASNDLCRLFVD